MPPIVYYSQTSALRDAYVGMMKGVIAGIAPKASRY